MDLIDNLPLKENSKKLYKAAIRNHCLGIDLYDIDAIRERIKNLGRPTQILCLNAIAHITHPDNDAVIKERTRLYLKEQAVVLKRPIPEMEKDFEALIDEAYKRCPSQENHSIIVLLFLMKYHPRRFGDYYLISNVQSKEVNFLDQTNNIIKFNFFKNAESQTAGQREIYMHPIVAEQIAIYIKKWEVKGRLFPMTKRRLRYLMQKYDIPKCNDNRKIQETEAIQSGLPHDEVAEKFNHSISTQMLSYVKKQ
jgi:hypothetical protein